MLELTIALIPVATVVLGVVIYAIRIEGHVKMLHQRDEHLEGRIDRQDSEIRERLGKIDARLESIANTLERVIWRIPKDNDRNDD